MSGSLGKSESGQSAGFNQDVWGPSGEARSNLFDQIGGLFNTSMGGKNNKGARSQMQSGLGLQDAAMSNALPAWQQQMQGGPYQDMNLTNRLGQSLDQSLQSPSAMQEINSMIMGGEGNNYADAMKNTFMMDAQRAQDRMLSNLDQRAALAGQSGGSRHGVATALGMRDINDALTRNMANVGYKTFDKDLDRKLNIAQQADQGTLARQQMMGNMLGDQAGVMERGVGFSPTFMNLGMQQQMMPWQQAQSYGNIIGDPTVLSSGSSSGSSKGFGASGGASKSK